MVGWSSSGRFVMLNRAVCNVYKSMIATGQFGEVRMIVIMLMCGQTKSVDETCGMQGVWCIEIAR